MTLYTKDDSFQISFDNEEARDSWLLTIRALISMHRDARPMFGRYSPYIIHQNVRGNGLFQAWDRNSKL